MRRRAGVTGIRPPRVVLAYASAGFGLSMVAQAAFLVPLRARELGASFDVIGLIVGAGAVVAMFAAVPSGALLDRWGPKRTFVVAALATAVLSALFPLVTNYWWFLALQPLLGLTRNLGWMASQSYIASIGTPAQRPTLTGRFSMVSNVGQVGGPLLVGAAAQMVGFRWALLVPAAYALAFAVLGLLLADVQVRQQGQDRERQGAGLRSARELLAVVGIQVTLLLTVARLWITSVYVTFLPVYLTDSGLDVGVVGAVVATSGGVAAVAAPTAGYWARKASPVTVATLSLACGAIGLAVAPHITSVPAAFVVPALIGVGVGISFPLLLTVITTEAPPGQRGVALGLRGVATQGGMTAAPLVAGPVIGLFGITIGFTAAAVFAAAMLVGARELSRRGMAPASTERDAQNS